MFRTKTVPIFFKSCETYESTAVDFSIDNRIRMFISIKIFFLDHDCLFQNSFGSIKRNRRMYTAE